MVSWCDSDLLGSHSDFKDMFADPIQKGAPPGWRRRVADALTVAAALASCSRARRWQTARWAPSLRRRLLSFLRSPWPLQGSCRARRGRSSPR